MIMNRSQKPSQNMKSLSSFLPQYLKSCKKAKSIQFPSYKSCWFTKKQYQEVDTFFGRCRIIDLRKIKTHSIISELLVNYSWFRNRSEGLNYSSKLSPYLALSYIYSQLIFEVVKDYKQLIARHQSTWWLIFELVW